MHASKQNYPYRQKRSIILFNLWTLVSSFNHKAQHFYEKMGFIKVGQLDDLIVEGYSEFLLRKLA